MAFQSTRFLSFLAGVLALSACNGAGGSQVLIQPGTVSSPQAYPEVGTSDRLYVAAPPYVREYAIPEHGNRGPLCYDSLPPSASSYSGGGIGVNAAHILYVPVHTLGKIFTFGPNCGPAGPTLKDPGGAPGDVAFDNERGIVYVSNLTNGCVEVYEHGATSPTRALCENGFNTTRSVAVHGDGDVYATVSKQCYQYYSCAHLVKFPHGRQKGAWLLPLDDHYFQYTWGITFDLKGNLLAFQFLGEPFTVTAIYPPPYKGAPARQTCSEGALGVFGALDSSNKHLYVGAVMSVSRPNAYVGVYSYPSCTYEYSIDKPRKSGGQNLGIAIDSRSGS